MARARDAPRVARGPWHLGRFGTAINTIAILWVIFLSIVLSVPDDMRAGKSILALTAVLGLWYGLGERRRFPGPAWTARSVGPSNGSSVPSAPVIPTRER